MPSATSSQTIGPFWHLIEHPEWADLTRLGAAGARVTLTGSVIDGDGNPVTDAAVELWQADPPAEAQRANWLPAPKGSDFSLFLRAYWPKTPIIDGSWTPPAVMKAN